MNRIKSEFVTFTPCYPQYPHLSTHNYCRVNLFLHQKFNLLNLYKITIKNGAKHGK